MLKTKNISKKLGLFNLDDVSLQVNPDDYYVFVHVLCEKCDFLKGFNEEANKKQSPILLKA